MSERPLLLFPIPQKADRTKQTPSYGHVHRPNATRQGQRLSPIFDQLQLAFDARRIEIQQNAAGIDPEQVLIIETVGTIDNFANAVKKINGLEWLGELEVDEIAPDEDFYDEGHPDKKLNGRLFLIMTNRRALDEMLSLWQRYQADTTMTFERGLTKFRDVFLHLKSIRRWDVQDRLLETGLIDIWKEDLQYDGDRVIPFEAELWFRGSSELRAASVKHVTDLVNEAGGNILSQSLIEGIAYHSLLAELPANAIQSILDNPSTELVKCENIMFFRPVGQMMAGDTSLEGDVEITVTEAMPLPTGEPIIALFDGLPLANHSLLAGRLTIDDPDNWDQDYIATERVHGTSMASLITLGDLNQAANPLTRPIYVRPIMKPLDRPYTPRPEGIPENCLAVDLIHRAVKRLFENDQGEAPAAPHVKVINLSIGDSSRQFVQSMSPIARLLDWLSVKYNVLFIVSAGNHSSPISLGVTREEFSLLQPNERESATIKALYRDARNRRLLSPAETINGLTIGALHDDSSTPSPSGRGDDPFTRILPSPISAFGSGYRRAIKPEILFTSGRQYYRPSLVGNPVNIEAAIYKSAPGNKTAYAGNLAGSLDNTAYSCGTSNATALISRAAGICYDSLLQLLSEQVVETNSESHEVPLLKAMLVHGCSWGDIGSRMTEVLQTPTNTRQLRGLISRWVGYGVPIVDRVLDCTEQRATVLGFGQLSDGEAHVFSLPLPPSLSSRPEKRRLTITLAWLSPIAPSTQKYRTASLWFEMTGTLTPSRSDAEWRAVRRGTIQHEVFEGDSAEPFMDGDVIQIKVNCREDAGKIRSPIAYGLMVSLEVGEGVDIAVYSEIRTRIAPAIQIQQANRLG